MKLKGNEILINCLLEQKVDIVFGYPGGCVLDLYDCLYDYQDKIKHILTCHEQHACHAADGYARASGKTGVVIATSGPGATNLVTGIANAFMDSIPLVAITGNVNSCNLGRDSFQEVDITGITMPITKHNFIVKNISELQTCVRQAFYIASSGRKGPVLIDIPKNIFTEEFEYEFKEPKKYIPKKEKTENLNDIAEIIKNSKKPMIISGGGIISSNACEEILQFAKLTGAPIACTLMGLGSCSTTYELYTGMIGMHGTVASALACKNADLIIAVGMRFSDRVAQNRETFSKNKKIIHIDIDTAEINKNIQTFASITADAKEALTTLNLILSSNCSNLQNFKEKDNLKQNSLQQNNFKLDSFNIGSFNSDSFNIDSFNIDSFNIERENWKNEVLSFIEKNTPNKNTLAYHIISYLSDNYNNKLIIATDVGQHQMWTAQYYNFNKARTLITSGGLGAMGFGLGGAIGAQLATGKQTVLITGDGSFHMNFNELATVKKHNLPIIIFVMNNNVLGMVRQWQKMFYKERYSETTLDRNTNYQKLAAAFDIDSAVIEKIEDIKPTIDKALNSKKPYVIDCKLKMDDSVLPMIPPQQSFDKIVTKL